MLKTQVMERGSGKTKTIVEKMRKDPNSIVFIHHKGTKRIFDNKYGDLKYRTYSFCDLGAERSNKTLELLAWFSKKPKCRVFIDEGFIGEPDDLAHLYFALGQYNVNVESFGSIEKNKNSNYKKSLFDEKIIPSLLFEADPKNINELIIVDSQEQYFKAINYLNTIHKGNFDFKAQGFFEGIQVTFDEHKYYITTLKKLQRGRRFSSVRFLNFKGDK